MKDGQPKLSLLRFRDLYVVIAGYSDITGEPDWYDYKFHSHQCPEAIMRSVVAVFCPSEGADPHGVFRYIASVDDNEENTLALNTETATVEQLFRLFGTDGSDAPTNWPEHQRGLIPLIAYMQDEHRKNKAPKA
jgi:hypothetical protein